MAKVSPFDRPRCQSMGSRQEVERFDWVSEGVRGIRSCFDADSVSSIKECLGVEDWERAPFDIDACPESASICDYSPDDHFFIFNLYFVQKVGARLPLSAFEFEFFCFVNIAPTQLHSNGWGFLQAFKRLCFLLECPPRVDVFLHFFMLKDPSRGRGFLYLSARPKNALIRPVEESAKEWKDQFFRVTAPRGGSAARPFFLDEGGRPRFPLRWQSFITKPRAKPFGDFDEAGRSIIMKLAPFVREKAKETVLKARALIQGELTAAEMSNLARLNQIRRERGARSSATAPVVISETDTPPSPMVVPEPSRAGPSAAAKGKKRQRSPGPSEGGRSSSTEVEAVAREGEVDPPFPTVFRADIVHRAGHPSVSIWNNLVDVPDLVDREWAPSADRRRLQAADSLTMAQTHATVLARHALVGTEVYYRLRKALESEAELKREIDELKEKCGELSHRCAGLEEEAKVGATERVRAQRRLEELMWMRGQAEKREARVNRRRERARDSKRRLKARAEDKIGDNFLVAFDEGFNLCRDQVAVLCPHFPFEGLDPEKAVVDGEFGNPVEGAPDTGVFTLEESEVDVDTADEEEIPLTPPPEDVPLNLLPEETLVNPGELWASPGMGETPVDGAKD